MKVLISSAHWLLEEDQNNRVLVLRRLRHPFASVDELKDANRDILRHVRKEHETWGVVVDMRQAKSRNDPEFELAMRGLRDAVEERFARTAVLLATKVGLLQVTRLTREDGASTFATQDEGEALRFARGETQRRESH